MALNTTSRNDLIKETVLTTGLKHIAIIMDGNRRWAKNKNLSTVFGHREGVKSLKNTIKAANTLGIKYLTVYAFSTENWGRKHEEVEFLMNLLKETVQNEIQEMNDNNVRLRIIGDLAPLSEDLKTVLVNAEKFTEKNSGLNLQIAINYGSRSEITNAVKRIYEDIKSGIIDNAAQITDEFISSYLYTAEIPDPDLLIRTGGEQRLSNYLLWQSAYTEIYITDTFWPDFDRAALEKAVQAFASRSRRYGKD